MIFNRDVAGESCPVGHYDVIADMAVVGDMAIGHEQIAVPNCSFTITCDGPRVYGCEFTDYISVAYLEEGFFTFVFQILRNRANRRQMENLVVFPDFGPTLDYSAGPDFCASTNFYVFTYDDERSYFNVSAQFSTRVNYCRRMYHQKLQI
jgi:hypothetical protein